jgi:hypothetical protein
MKASLTWSWRFLAGRGTADMVKRAEARLGKIGLPFVMEVDEGGCMPRIAFITKALAAALRKPEVTR